MIAHSFNAELHQYAVENSVIPSVTQILDLVGFTELPTNPYVLEKIEYKRQVGSMVDLATQYLDEGDIDLESVDEAIAGYVLAYQNFRTESGFVPTLIQHRQIAEIDGMRYGMTLDREGLLGDEETIIDLKCTYTLGKAVGIQLAGYALGRGGSKRRAALQLKKDGTYKLHRCDDEQDFEDFRAALRVVYWRINHGLLRNFQ